MNCRIETIGAFQILVDGELRPLAIRKAQLVLARLLTGSRHGLGRDTISRFLWEGRSEEQARVSLRQTLTHIRRALGDAHPVLVADDDRLKLDLNRVSSDLGDLQASLRGEISCPKELLNAGDFLEGMTAREPAIQDWLEAERRRVRHQIVEALDREAVSLINAHDLGAALALIFRALELEPLRESLHRLAMRALAAQGEVAAAIKQFQHCCEILSRELGVSPEAETRELYQHLKSARQRSTVPAPRAAGFSEEAGSMLAAEIREAILVAVLPPSLDDPEDDGVFAGDLAPLVEEAVQSTNGTVVSDSAANPGQIVAFGLARAIEAERPRADAFIEAVFQRLPSARIGTASGRVLRRTDRGVEVISGEPRRLALARASIAGAGRVNRGDNAPTGDAVTRGRPGTPFVGRRREMRQLDAIAAMTIEDGIGAVAFVVGEPGIGKTSLVGAFRDRFTADGGTCLAIEFQVFGQTESALRRLGSQLDAKQQVRSAGPAGDAMRAIITGADMPAGGDALLAAMPSERFGALSADIFLQLIDETGRPHLLIVEDTHWAGDGALRFLVEVAARVAERPVVLLVTERPAEARFGPALQDAEASAPVVTLALNALDLRDAAELAATFRRPPERTQQSISRAEGNPLFLVRLLEDEGEALPSSVVSLIQEQLDRLTPEDRTQIRQASVLGVQFTASDFRAAFGGGDLGAAILQGFLRRDGDRYRFSHALVHDAICSSITKADRRALHAKAANYFMTRDPVLWAEHALAARAADVGAACAAAADALLPRYQFDTARRFIDAGLDLDGSDDNRATLLLCRGSLRRERGELNAALADYEAASALDSTPDVMAQAVARQAWVHRLRGELTRADERLAVARRIPEERLSRDIVSEIENQLGAQAFQRGDPETCLQHNRRALEFADSPLYLSRAHGGLGDAHYAAGRMRSARNAFETCIELARRHGLGIVEMNHGFMGAISHHFADPGDAAMAKAEVAVERATAAGVVRAEMIALQVLAELRIAAMMLDEAEQDLRRADHLIALLDAVPFALEQEFTWATLLDLRGDRDAALARLRRALERIDDSGSGYFLAVVVAGLGRFTTDAVERDKALARLEELLQAGSVGHAHFWGRQYAAEALLHAGDLRGAEMQADRLADYTSSEPLGWTDLVVERMRFLVEVARTGISEPLVQRGADLVSRLDAARLRNSIRAIRNACGPGIG